MAAGDPICIKGGENPMVSEKTIGAAILLLSKIDAIVGETMPLPLIFSSSNAKAEVCENARGAPRHEYSAVCIINPVDKLEWIGSGGVSFNPTICRLMLTQGEIGQWEIGNDSTRIPDANIAHFFGMGGNPSSPTAGERDNSQEWEGVPETIGLGGRFMGNCTHILDIAPYVTEDVT